MHDKNYHCITSAASVPLQLMIIPKIIFGEETCYDQRFRNILWYCSCWNCFL